MSDEPIKHGAAAPTISTLVERGVAGERQALARLLSMAERGDERLLEIEEHLAAHAPSAHVVGITGPPGAGKSTLINALLPHTQHTVDRVAVLAIDPSSPFSGGAILGDRVRMQDASLGSSVFIRSMASRGDIGGLAHAAATSVRLFDACGWPLVIIETLGIGQVELDIMELADTVVVVLNPGWGDSIQANKAGLTEAGDIFVVNKADRPGAQQCIKDLQESLTLSKGRRTTPIVETVAVNGSGLDNLWREIDRHRVELSSDSTLSQRRANRQRRLLRKILTRQLHQLIEQTIDSSAGERWLAEAAQGKADTATMLRALLKLV